MQYLIEFFKTKKKTIFFILLASLLQSFGTLMVPYFVAKIIDVGIAQQSITAVVTIGLQMLAAAGITALISLWGSYLCADFAALTGKFLREKIFDKTQLLSIREFNHFGTASMITRATGDITLIQQTVIMVAQLVLPTPLIAVASIVMTAAINPDLVYIPLCAMLAFFILVFFLFKKSSPISQTIQNYVDTVNRVVRESIVGIRVIRAFDNTAYEKQKTDDAFSEYADNVIRLNRIFSVFNPVVWGIMGIVMAVVVWFGGYLVLQEKMLIGGISAVTEYTILVLMYLMMTASVLVTIPRMRSCIQRIREVLDTDLEIADAKEVQALSVKTSEKIVFQNAAFSYQGAEEPVVEGLSFVCEQGKTTAIIGGTGSGKSTVSSLMLRLHDIQEGNIFLEGRDIRTISQHDLRKAISFVPQKAFLFSGTIADNLRMGKKDASIEELVKAAETAQAHSFISALPNGYESEVSQGGTNFSGGQKQRLCIARALVKKASVYIFDDSFSALDFKTDAALRAALKQEMKDAAVVIIAQRISTIMDADQIIVLDSGKIAGIGTHAELLKTCDIYKEIADSQLTEKEEHHEK
ncbi:ABC transporter ATP-binding protein [Konateibacter massiliensis]|uniref:ABC transporter ATP-binding protein n=1 Tax=Konateibacter massiliensis TaxID=2002841 RepID=UPI000C161A6D|nr:ABC transporter ATP-binding protein [Konateibacter massiliensis]